VCLSLTIEVIHLPWKCECPGIFPEFPSDTLIVQKISLNFIKKLSRGRGPSQWVKFGDYTGIILIVDLQWKRVPINPLDFGEIGGAIKLVVMSVLEDSKKFYGSLKHLHPDDNPWKDENYYRNGMLIGGKPYEKVAYGYRIVLETNAIAILETVDVTKELELGIEYTFRIKDSDPKKQIVWVELGK